MSTICDYHESNELSGWYSLNPHWWFQRSLCAGVWLDFNATCYWKLSLSWTCWRTTETGAKFYQSSWKRYWTHCIGWTNVVGCSWQVWCCWKECLKMDNFALQQIINRALCSSFGTSVRSPQTMFQLLIMTLLLLSTHNPAICRVNIESWFQSSDMNFILQTLLDVRGTVFSSSTTSRWCQHHYSPVPAFVAFIQYMQLFISSSFDRKKLQEFTMLRYCLL